MMKYTGKLVIGMGLVLLQSPVQAGNISKANNTTGWATGTAWTGGIAPGSGDIAVLDSTLTSVTTANLGASMSIGGILVTNPAANQTLGTTTGAVLTLGSSGIDMSSATANFNLNAVLDLTASQTWTVASGRSLLIGGTNTGNGTITLAGSGTYLFSTGSNGGAVAGAASAFTSGPLGTGTVNIGNGVTLASSGAGRTIRNAVSLNGDIGVDTSAQAFNFSGGINVGSATRTIAVTGANTLNFGGFAGTGGAFTTVSGTGRVVFSNAAPGTYPTVTVRDGSGVTNDYAVFDTDVTIGSGVSFVASVSAFTANTDLVVDGTLNTSNGGGASTSQTFASLSGAGTIFNGGSTAGISNLTIDGGSNTTTTTYSGTIINGSTTVGGVTATNNIIKTGTTTQILSGTNTYIGSTAVNGGTLLVNGTHIQTIAGSGYTVANGGTLGGTGTIARFSAVTNAAIVAVVSGGTIAPGGTGTIGAFTLDGQYNNGTTSKALTMALGSGFKFDLAGNGTSADTLNFWNFNTGELTLANNAVDFTLVGTQAAGTYTVNLFQFYSDSGTTFTTSGITTGLTLGTLDSSISAANFVYNSGGGLIQLQYTVIPEPSTYALLGVGLGGLWFLRRRSRQA